MRTLDRIVPAIQIARCSRLIALESVVAGIGLSLLCMIAAALGYIMPVQGALLQEAIDVAGIPFHEALIGRGSDWCHLTDGKTRLSHLDLSAGARRSASISRFAEVFFIQSLLRPVGYRTAGTGAKPPFE